MRSALLIHCHTDALSKSFGTFLITLDQALILVRKSDWPPGLARHCGACLATKETTEIMLAKRIGIVSLLKQAVSAAFHPDCLRQTHVVAQSIPTRCPVMMPRLSIWAVNWRAPDGDGQNFTWALLIGLAAHPPLIHILG